MYIFRSVYIEPKIHDVEWNGKEQTVGSHISSLSVRALNYTDRWAAAGHQDRGLIMVPQHGHRNEGRDDDHDFFCVLWEAPQFVWEAPPVLMATGTRRW